jgi:hypothetical protein
LSDSKKEVSGSVKFAVEALSRLWRREESIARVKVVYKGRMGMRKKIKSRRDFSRTLELRRVN